MNQPLLTAALAAAALTLGTAASAGPIAYTLADNGSTLVRFNTATPGATTAVGSLSGAATQLDGIDFRPVDGLLYGYSQATNTVVTINLSNAVTTLVTIPTAASTTRNMGIDFNPVADRMRVVNDDDQNLRINVGTGAALVDTPLAYAVGDVNEGANPGVNEAAYTNSDTDALTGTSLFYIDADLDILVSTTNPNGGVLNTVGSLGVDTSDLTGFDIFSNGLGGNAFYALLTAASGTASLYKLNSGTGAASLIGEIDQMAGSRPHGLALVRGVPGPDAASSTALLGFALAGVALMRRRLNAG